jgi:transcriptional repressor NrdR
VKCIMCGFEDTAVIDSRVVEDGKSIRRRRSCPTCMKRFTTYEKAEEMPLWVIKRDKSREPFEKQKLINGLVKACQKRPVSLEQLEEIASGVERAAQENNEKEIAAHLIGELVMQTLRNVDDVAYVRFASVYRSFRDANEFAAELQRMKEL